MPLKRSTAQKPGPDEQDRYLEALWFAKDNGTAVDTVLITVESCAVIDQQGQIPLMFATYLKKETFFAILTATPQNFVNHADRHGYTALHHLANSNFSENAGDYAHALLKNGANPELVAKGCRECRTNDETALDVAVRHSNDAVSSAIRQWLLDRS